LWGRGVRAPQYFVPGTHPATSPPPIMRMQNSSRLYRAFFVSQNVFHFATKTKRKGRAIAGRTTRCRCNFDTQPIEIYNCIARFLCHSTAFLYASVTTQMLKLWHSMHCTLIFTAVTQNRGDIAEHHGHTTKIKVIVNMWLSYSLSDDTMYAGTRFACLCVRYKKSATLVSAAHCSSFSLVRRDLVLYSHCSP